MSNNKGDLKSGGWLKCTFLLQSNKEKHRFKKSNLLHALNFRPTNSNCFRCLKQIHSPYSVAQ